MSEDCDWSLFISCCVETMCLCCTLCEEINKIAKCLNNNEENSFTNPVNPNGNYIAEQPYSPQQFPSRYSTQPQLLPQQFGEQQYSTVPNSGLNLSPSASFLGNNYASNQSIAAGITSLNYSAPPPSYSEAMGMETQTQAQPSISSDRHISKT